MREKTVKNGEKMEGKKGKKSMSQQVVTVLR
jgi:hypothetical protein